MSDAGHNLVRIGQVLKTNDTSGEFVMGFREISPDDIDIKEPVFIKFDGTAVPFFIKNFSQRGVSKALVKLTDIDSQADAEEIKGQAVYVRAESLGEDTAVEDDLSFLIGWTLFDKSGTPVGRISDFMDIPGNPCIVADTASGQVTIPLHEDLVVSIDEGTSTLVMDIPEGLL